MAPFVNYMEPDFLQDDDDGTDLPLPDLAELAPAPQGRRPGRNRGGRPLRELQNDDPAQETTEAGDADEQAFGEGLADDEAVTTSVADASPPESESQTTTADKPKRRRRRRRRGRGNKSRGGAADTDGRNAEDESAEVTKQLGTEATGSETSSDSSASPDGKRRRRRRRNRRRGSGGSQAGDTNSLGTSGDSSPTSDKSVS